MKKEDIIKKIKQSKNEIRKLGVTKIGIFGSFVKEKQNKNSDVDIVINISKPTFDNYMGTFYLLQKLLKRKVDLVIESDLKPELEYIKDEAEYVKI